MLPKALKSCPKCKKSPNLVTLVAGLVVKGGDSESRARRQFDFQHQRDKFSHAFVVRLDSCLNRPKVSEKLARENQHSRQITSSKRHTEGEGTR